MTPIIKIDNLYKSYKAGKEIISAVTGLSLTVMAGEIYGLLGPNGAGKTTTLRCLATLLQPDSGTITVAGSSDPRLIRQKIGYVAQEVALDKVLTGRELLEFQAGLYHLPPATAQRRIAEVLQVLQLEEYADRQTGKYSGGLKKRLDLALGLLHAPQVLILDEPTVGLDIQTRLGIWQFLRELKQMGITVFLTSHYLEEIDALADRVGIINQGKLIAEGTPTALKNQVGGDRLTIRIQEFTSPAEAQSALDLIKDLPFVRSALINPAQGNAINLVISPDPQGVGKIQEILTQAGKSIFSLTQSRPSLDDVFLSATGQTILDADLAQAEKAYRK
ncbi:MAG: ATP-binding cassette domain-containing protein [Pseudanabaenaceae cyanobacterium]